MMPPANAAAIYRVLTDITSFSLPLLTRSDQETYLKNLTSTYKFTYYSATYGHTTHDANSLRKVLANTMRHHPNPEFGTAGGNAAVDMLFEHGCEMLEPAYVEEVRLAALKEVVERIEEDDDTSEEEEHEILGCDIFEGEDSEHDEDFVPARKRPRRRKPFGPRKRKVSVSSLGDGTSSTKGCRRDSNKSEQTKQKRGKVRQIEAATESTSGGSKRVMKNLKEWQRSNIGQKDATKRSQPREQCGRNGAETEAIRLQGCRQLSALVECCESRHHNEPLSLDEMKADGELPDNVRMREAVERLNRRVHAAILQLWDEIGGIA